ncbi:putative flavoprotein involved in K+ transport [Fictibacillus solisalsi]|uniref:Putative flavoprotein involved in K+ transport n=1 Tax=Fictibacillus solisalsi TaxID=459525 RepID=A0A1G9YDV5_9BACL|nr:NAD(P)/FAD-dependent oxidoreductase [Fictibacillus solisalsi]SDN06651.1 putative flavoprotein involved in K+ transport [Fictibacillus solisalsi]
MKVDVLIIGAGQAGIAMNYVLRNKGLHTLMIDSNSRIGDSWRKRYNSLVLFTPKEYSSLPGLTMEGNQQDFPTKDEMAAYLEKYVSYFELPYQLNIRVESVTKKAEHFSIVTNHGEFTSKNVIVASGAFQKPFIPPIAEVGGKDVFHIHSSEYINPARLDEGSVLVVGGGNSGAQIAVELANERNVWLAASHPFKFLPLRVLGKSTFYWLDKMGLLYAGMNTKKGKWFYNQKDPIFGRELKKLIATEKVTIKPKVVKVKGDEVEFADSSKVQIKNIVWATGFVPSYEWIRIEGALLSNGRPIHNRGISPVKGLYFIGLPWQNQRGSSLVCGVGRDAYYIANHLA